MFPFSREWGADGTSIVVCLGLLWEEGDHALSSQLMLIHPWASPLVLLFGCTSTLMLHLCPAHPKSCTLPLTSISSFPAWSQETKVLLHRRAQNDVDQLQSLQPAGYA